MEYIYAALLLHAAKKDITEAAVTKVLDATGTKSDAARVKALVASLDGVNIEEAIKKAAAPVAAAPAASAPSEAKKEEKKEDEGKKAEEAAAGLSSLFG